jgi:glycosyltransferase involved in cell wall biosynthesis
LEAEFYYYDNLYDIGKYDKELPLCVVATGKNNAKTIVKLYESINRQNYTNYKIVHIDDHSNDGTINIVLKFLSSKPQIK